MAAVNPPWAADLLHVWFDILAPRDWFAPDRGVDAMLRRKFENILFALSNQPTAQLGVGPRRTLAAILLFDQIPRNIYRDTPQAFAFDRTASSLAKRAIDQNWDAALPDRQRQFIAMPLMHSENIADQEMSRAYFARHLSGNLSFARSHHAMIARFGRFPHRNGVLGRITTAREQAAIDAGFNW
ncbi:MAG: DUF924 family protein [Pontixanthobacter sp.]